MPIAKAFSALMIFMAASVAAEAQVIGFHPQLGPICGSPAGPMPCAMAPPPFPVPPFPSPPPLLQPLPPPVAAGQLGGFPPIPPPRGSAQATIPPPREVLFPLPRSIGIEASASASSVRGAVECARLTQSAPISRVDAFLVCTRGAIVLDKRDAALVKCAERFSGNQKNMKECAQNAVLDSILGHREREIVACASQSDGDRQEFLTCLAAPRMSAKQREVLRCAQDGDVRSMEFAGCAASALFGDQVPKEARAAVRCAAKADGDVTVFGVCAANNVFGFGMNPELEIAVSCAASSGGQPYAAAACTAGRLTARELEKCGTQGFGGDGCFGDSNDLVGRDGFVVRNLAGIAGGSNSVINNPGQVLGGPNSVFNNPGQLLGGPNSFPNQVLRQIPSPPPIQVGTVGGRRICIPWC